MASGNVLNWPTITLYPMNFHVNRLKYIFTSAVVWYTGCINGVVLRFFTVLNPRKIATFLVTLSGAVLELWSYAFVALL